MMGHWLLPASKMLYAPKQSFGQLAWSLRVAFCFMNLSSLNLVQRLAFRYSGTGPSVCHFFAGNRVRHLPADYLVRSSFAGCLVRPFLRYSVTFFRYVYPLRDAAVRILPMLSAILPEYALVPPPPSVPNTAATVQSVPSSSSSHTTSTSVETPRPLPPPDLLPKKSSLKKTRSPPRVVVIDDTPESL